MTEKEYERKAIIGREKYDMLLAEFTGKYPREDIFQINHYYDTPDFALYQSGETLRVRQTESTLKLQYKYNKNYFGDMRVSDEYSETIGELPKTIKINGLKAQNTGVMATERRNFDLGDCTVSLDKNYYLGAIDYEIEVETEKEHDLPDVLDEIGFDAKTNGKYSRYVEKLSKQKCEAVVSPKGDDK